VTQADAPGLVALNGVGMVNRQGRLVTGSQCAHYTPGRCRTRAVATGAGCRAEQIQTANPLQKKKMTTQAGCKCKIRTKYDEAMMDQRLGKCQNLRQGLKTGAVTVKSSLFGDRFCAIFFNLLILNENNCLFMETA
jgi:hypothetical protein